MTEEIINPFLPDTAFEKRVERDVKKRLDNVLSPLEKDLQKVGLRVSGPTWASFGPWFRFSLLEVVGLRVQPHPDERFMAITSGRSGKTYVSDGQHCQCEAGQHERDCRHSAAVRLFRHGEGE